MKYSCMFWSSSRSASYCSPSFSMQHRKFICNVFLLFCSFVKARGLCVSFVERTKSFSPSILTRRNASNVEPSFTSKKSHFLNYYNRNEFIVSSVFDFRFLYSPDCRIYINQAERVSPNREYLGPWLLCLEEARRKSAFANHLCGCLAIFIISLACALIYQRNGPSLRCIFTFCLFNHFL